MVAAVACAGLVVGGCGSGSTGGGTEVSASPTDAKVTALTESPEVKATVNAVPKPASGKATANSVPQDTDNPWTGLAGGPASRAAARENAADRPRGRLACATLKVSILHADLMRPGAIATIQSFAAGSPVAPEADKLASAYTTAIASRGAPTEAQANMAVGDAAAALHKACGAHGLLTVGNAS